MITIVRTIHGAIMILPKIIGDIFTSIMATMNIISLSTELLLRVLHVVSTKF